jgi:hypothetical protein
MPAFASAEHRRAHARQPARQVAEDPAPSGLPDACLALATVSDLRRKRAARQLAEAERGLRRLTDEHAGRKAEWIRSKQSANEFERDWYRAHLGREIICRDLRAARSAQSKRDALSEQQADALASTERNIEQARVILVEIRRRYAATERKVEKLRVMRQRLAPVERV